VGNDGHCIEQAAAGRARFGLGVEKRTNRRAIVNARMALPRAMCTPNKTSLSDGALGIGSSHSLPVATASPTATAEIQCNATTIG